MAPYACRQLAVELLRAVGGAGGRFYCKRPEYMSTLLFPPSPSVFCFAKSSSLADNFVLRQSEPNYSLRRWKA